MPYAAELFRRFLEGTGGKRVLSSSEVVELAGSDPQLRVPFDEDLERLDAEIARRLSQDMQGKKVRNGYPRVDSATSLSELQASIPSSPLSLRKDLATTIAYIHPMGRKLPRLDYLLDDLYWSLGVFTMVSVFEVVVAPRAEESGQEAWTRTIKSWSGQFFDDYDFEQNHPETWALLKTTGIDLEAMPKQGRAKPFRVESVRWDVFAQFPAYSGRRQAQVVI